MRNALSAKRSSPLSSPDLNRRLHLLPTLHGARGIFPCSAGPASVKVRFAYGAPQALLLRLFGRRVKQGNAPPSPSIEVRRPRCGTAAALGKSRGHAERRGAGAPVVRRSAGWRPSPCRSRLRRFAQGQPHRVSDSARANKVANLADSPQVWLAGRLATADGRFLFGFFPGGDERCA